MMNKLIYFDNAATTKLSKPAFDAMLPFLGMDTATRHPFIQLAGTQKMQWKTHEVE